MKVVPGNSNPTVAQLQQQGYVQVSGPQPNVINDPNQRPVLRRVDSRGQFPYRPPGPYQNPPPVQGAPPQRPPQPIRPPGAYIPQRPPPPQGQPRFPTPIPQRFPPPETPPEGYRRPINSPENQFARFPTPRPPQPPLPRPTIAPQRSIPGPIPYDPKKTTPDQDYDEPPKPFLAQIRNQSFSSSKNSDIMSPSQDDRQDPEKDIDTTTLNGKTHEEPPKNPPSMLKIEEDDDDLVVPKTPIKPKPDPKYSGTTKNPQKELP